MTPILLATAVFIMLHNVDGDELLINIDHIIMLQLTKEAKGGVNELISGGNKCVIGLDNGKFISVVEPCGMVRQAIRQAEKLS